MRYRYFGIIAIETDGGGGTNLGRIDENLFNKITEEVQRMNWRPTFPAASHDAAEEMIIQELQKECDSCLKPEDVPCIFWVVERKCKSREWLTREV